jgi:hypothetical protein
MTRNRGRSASTLEPRKNAWVEFAKEEPFIAFLIVGVICSAAVEIAAIIFLHHPIEINF